MSAFVACSCHKDFGYYLYPGGLSPALSSKSQYAFLTLQIGTEGARTPKGPELSLSFPLGLLSGPIPAKLLPGAK